MTVNELIELLSTQPGDYEVAVRTMDNDNLSIWEDTITGLAEVETPDDGMPGHVILNYEGNETGEPPDDDDEPEMTEHHLSAVPAISSRHTRTPADMKPVPQP